MPDEKSNTAGSVPEFVRTTDHEEIRRWAEDRKGRPVAVKYAGDDPTRTLRIEFGDQRPGTDEDVLTWDDFFEWFEEKQLALVRPPDSPARENGTHEFVPRR